MAKLDRSLGFTDVFSISTGAMISSGLFILPAVAFGKSGPALLIAYLIAALLVIPPRQRRNLPWQPSSPSPTSL